MPRTRLIAYPDEELRQALDAYVADQRTVHPDYRLSESEVVCMVLRAGLKSIARDHTVQIQQPPFDP